MARHTAQHQKPARTSKLLGLACLTASLMLSACAETSEILGPTAAIKGETQTASADSGAPQSELQKATTYWGQEFSKNPTDLKSALAYARNLKALGEKQKAMSVLQQASVYHESDRELAGEYGRLALEFDQFGAAAKMLEVADDPTKPDWKIISARGTVLAKQGQYKEAIPFYERALTLSQNQPSVLNNLAMAYAMGGEAKKAEDILRQATNSPDASSKVHQNLALVLGLQGRYDEANREGGKAIAINEATSNTDYIRKMVKLEPAKTTAPVPAAPAATAATAVAKAVPFDDSFKTVVKPVQQPVANAVQAVRTAPAAVASALRAAPADAPLDPEGGWDTAVASAAPVAKAAATSNPLFKGSSR